MDMEEEVSAAYEAVKRIDILDVSPDGTEIFLTFEGAYNERVARVENWIIARLRWVTGTDCISSSSIFFFFLFFFLALFLLLWVKW
jgi:hypothetical protein